MKKLISKIVVLLLFTLNFSLSTLLAQAPQAFKYQAVVRDNGGNVLTNHIVNFKISILKSSASGTAVYVETQKDTTNPFGLANLKIGNGTFVSGSFTTINWGNDEYFVKIEFDVNGGSSFQTMGTSQLLSVPYALYSQASGGDGIWTKDSNRVYLSDSTGNVGIGIIDPNQTLEVGKGIRIRESCGGNAGYYLDWSYGQISGGFTNWDLKVSDAGNIERVMRISSNGNVNIGNTNPLTKLQVNGPVLLNGVNANIDPNTGQGSAAYLSSMLNYTGNLLIGWNRSQGGGETDFITNRATGSMGGFQFYDYNGAPNCLMTIRGDGHVGIGTTYPTYPLSVNGTIQAKEVIVNTGWSDFVFDKDYKLMSLSELEKFINKNKHLPNIPSVSEVEKNGAKLGEINSKLLQQIEEITLRMIDQNKMMEEQNKKIELLNDKIEKLERNVR